MVRLVSSDILCANASDCFPVTGARLARDKWINKHVLHVAETWLGERIVVPVQMLGDPSKSKFWMDAVTGTLYRTNGKSLTNVNLELKKIRKEDGLAKWLKEVKSQDGTKPKIRVRGIGDKK